MRILITSPSLSINSNVSGISAVISPILQAGRHNYEHITAGATDAVLKNGGLFNRISTLLSSISNFLKEIDSADIVHINTAADLKASLRDLSFLIIAKIFKKAILLHIHGGLWLTTPPLGIAGKIKILPFQLLIKYSNSIIVLGNRQLSALKSISNPSKRVWILPNYVNLKAYSDTKENNSFLFLGRIEPSKGTSLLPDIFRHLKERGIDATLYIAGSGSSENELIDHLQRIGISYKFLGVISGENKWELLAKSEFFILPSFFEGLPMSLLEAVASGCIPVVSSVGDMPELVDEIGGIVVKKISSEYFSEMIFEYISQKRRPYTLNISRNLISFKEYCDKLDSIYIETQKQST